MAVGSLAIVAFAAYLLALHALVVRAASPFGTLALILAPWLLAAALSFKRGRRQAAGAMFAAIALVAAGAWFWRGSLATHVERLLLVENLCFVGSLAWLFGHSLSGGRVPLVTRLARMARGDDMPPPVLRYTRAATVGWTIFFACEAATSLVLYFTQSRETWSAFVNLLQWPLVVVAFAVEYAVRLRMLHGIRHSSPLAGFRTFVERDTP